MSTANSTIARQASALLILLAFLWLRQPLNAVAQDMEPRAFSPSPIGTNFILAGYNHSSGGVLLDPSLPVTDVEAKIDSEIVGYSRTFGLFGRAVSAAALLPSLQADISGNVGEQAASITRNGFADARFRVATNFIGGEALTKQEFMAHPPDTTLGTSLSIVAPTGEYNSEKLINIGSNRWAFKPEIGGSQQFGDWFVDASAGVWLFTNNENFYGGQQRSQDPLAAYQVHGGYTFMPGLWLAGDATYYTGGETSLDDIDKNDMTANSRYGVTLSLPLTHGFSLKLAYSKGLTTRIGGDFTTYAATLQYRWFDE